MTRIRPNHIPFMIAVLCAGCGSGTPQNVLQNTSNTVAPLSRNALYESNERPNDYYILAVVDGQLYMGPLVEDLSIVDIPYFMAPQGHLQSQAHEPVQCVFAGTVTFAVPRSRHAGQSFVCNGMRFTVEHCSDSTRCEGYSIIATCDRFEHGRCYPRRSRNNSARVPRLHGLAYRFRGSTREGITEIDFEPLTESGKLILRRGVGIFGTP